jgi:hypothetical protein
VPQILQCRIGGRPDQHHGEVALLVEEHQHLVAVEVALPGERIGHRSGLRPVAQAVLTIHVRHAARPAHGRRCPQPVDAPAGPPGRVHDQVRLHRGAVDHDPAYPSLRRQDAVDVPLPDREARDRLRRRPERTLEGVAAGPVAGRDDAGARQVERDGLGTAIEPGGQGCRPLLSERPSDLGPEAVRVVELHDARPRPPPGRRTGVAVHREDVVATAGQRAAEEQAGGPGSDDRDSHGDASSRARAAPRLRPAWWRVRVRVNGIVGAATPADPVRIGTALPSARRQVIEATISRAAARPSGAGTSG